MVCNLLKCLIHVFRDLLYSLYIGGHMTPFSKNADHHKIISNTHQQLIKKDGTKKSPRNSSESCWLWKLKIYRTLCQKRCILTFSTWTTRCLPAVCFSCKSFIVSLYIIKYWNEDVQHVYDSLLLFLKSFIFYWIPKKSTYNLNQKIFMSALFSWLFIIYTY